MIDLKYMLIIYINDSYIFFYFTLYIRYIFIFQFFINIFNYGLYKNRLGSNPYNRIDSVESFRFDSIKWIQIVIAKN